jgi:putative ATPase
MGKTTLARIIANTTKSRFKELSATSHGVNDVKKVFEEASNELHLTGRKTIIFMDEIHRFTKAQQDVFLPFVEKGTITLIGATTENPSFKVTSALLSRCRVFVLAPLTTEHVKQIIKRADEMMSLERDVKGLQIVSDELVDYLADLADGDGILLGFGELMVARNALNMFELTFSVALTVYQRGEKLTVDTLRPLLLRTQIVYDRKGDKHYDTISAFIKSMRHSGTPPIFDKDLFRS